MSAANARPTRRAADAAIALAGLATALLLFEFGIHEPMSARVRGDAREYAEIAATWPSASDAWNGVYARTVGMPLIDYVAMRAEAKLRAHLPATSPPWHWSTLVSAWLFAMHVLASAALSRWARQLGFVRDRRWGLLLFAITASFPAFIGHTTTPLTDTIAVDFGILACVALTAAMTMRHVALGRRLLASAAAGLCLLAAVLLRPAFLTPAAGSLLVVAAVWILRRQTRVALWLAWATVAATASGGLWPIVRQCQARFDTFCVQDPATFEPGKHAHMGLRGGRLLWNGPYPNNGEFPVLPDSTMAPLLYDACEVNRIIGTDDHSLTGCLLARPQLIPVYVLKKWIGLFDHFRFQPYMEASTPAWLRNLSRAYDGAAWAGLLAGLVALRRARPLLRSAHADEMRTNGGVVFAVALTLLLLAEHTLLHPEDRFGLVAVPFCLVASVAAAERQRDRWIHGAQSAWQLRLGVYTGWLALFYWQIFRWDVTSF